MALSKGDIWKCFRSVNVPYRKYHLSTRHSGRDWTVMTYFTDHEKGSEFQLYTIDPHQNIVRDINDVCDMNGTSPGGSFYVTERKEVIKPAEFQQATQSRFLLHSFKQFL